MTSPLKVGRERNGQLLHLRFDRPKANSVDAGMIAALDAAFAGVESGRTPLGVLLNSTGTQIFDVTTKLIFSLNRVRSTRHASESWIVEGFLDRAVTMMRPSVFALESTRDVFSSNLV